MKISHSASPRNRSSRNSRSPAKSCVVAGAAAVASAVLAPADARISVSATDSPALGSAMDVIGHRFWSWDLRELHDTINHIRPPIAGYARYGDRDGRRRRLM